MTHSFDVELALEYGVNAAIIFQSLLWWCEHSQANELHYHDGLYWTYNSNAAFQKLFPYMSGKQISTALSKLIEKGLIVKGNYNKNPYDRTLWYAVTQKGKSILPKCQMEEPKRENGNSENVRPIPVISPVNIYIQEEEERARAREETISGKKPNAFGDDDYRPNLDTVEQYAMQNLKYMGERAIDEFRSFQDDLPDDVIRHGIDNALDRDKRTWDYVRAILNRYVEEHVQTVGEAKQVDAKQRQKHAQSFALKNEPTNPFGLDRRNNKIPQRYGGGDIV